LTGAFAVIGNFYVTFRNSGLEFTLTVIADSSSSIFPDHVLLEQSGLGESLTI
jgi:hypothetical protein